MTPEDLLNLQVEEFNKGNVSFLMTLYENDACFASEPGQVVKDLESIRQNLQRFIEMRAKLKARVKKSTSMELNLMVNLLILVEEVRLICISKNNEIPMALLGELS